MKVRQILTAFVAVLVNTQFFVSAAGAPLPPGVGEIPALLYKANPTSQQGPASASAQAVGWDETILGDRIAASLSKEVTFGENAEGLADVVQVKYTGPIEFKTRHTLFVWSASFPLPAAQTVFGTGDKAQLLGKLFAAGPGEWMSDKSDGGGFLFRFKPAELAADWHGHLGAFIDGENIFVWTLKKNAGPSASRPAADAKSNAKWFALSGGARRN